MIKLIEITFIRLTVVSILKSTDSGSTNVWEKTVNDGEEEVDVVGENGVVTKRKKRKTKKVDTVRLLSGNYSRQIKEGDEWTVLAGDNAAKHLVSYHWPTAKEKNHEGFINVISVDIFSRCLC